MPETPTPAPAAEQPSFPPPAPPYLIALRREAARAPVKFFGIEPQAGSRGRAARRWWPEAFAFAFAVAAFAVPARACVRRSGGARPSIPS